MCAGLGRHCGIDPWPARLLFVLLLMVIPGSQILIFHILWILMPSEQTVMVRRRRGRVPLLRQAHLVRDWQRFTGLAPTDWIAHEFRVFQVTGVEDPTSLLA